ncbi:hypothetical protein J6590_023444 [Homalodisca vitripennis]|nr:hypothetical protein J6590_023444 [Homalodisca vitripennis]
MDSEFGNSPSNHLDVSYLRVDYNPITLIADSPSQRRGGGFLALTLPSEECSVTLLKQCSVTLLKELSVTLLKEFSVTLLKECSVTLLKEGIVNTAELMQTAEGIHW